MDHQTIPDLLDEQVNVRPDNQFLLTRESEFTYEEFDQITDGLAGELHERGIEPGDHVAIAMENRPAYVLFMFAAAKLGCPIVTIDLEYSAELVEYAVDISDSSAFVFDSSMAEQYEILAAEGIDFDLTIGVETETPADVVQFDELASTGEVPEVTVRFDTPFHITFSSGTTGDPKPILLHHHFWTSLASWINDDLGTDHTDRFFANLTLAHGNPYLGLMSALECGASIGLGREFSASRFWDDVRSFDANAVITHVTTADILLQQEPDRDHPGEVATFLGGHQVEPFMEKFGFEKVVSAYGSMEAGGLCVSYPVEDGDLVDADDNVVGWERPEFRVEVVDDDDNVLPPSEVGEIVVRPTEPSVMFEEYYNMPEKTVAATKNLWYHSDDLGYIDESGRLHFVGRADDSIRVKGRFVPIERVEKTIKQLDGVAECAIVGVEADVIGDEIKAYVQRTGKFEATPEKIVEHCEDHLASYMVPKHVAFVDQFPRSAGVQKIQRGELTELDVDEWTR